MFGVLPWSLEIAPTARFYDGEPLLAQRALLWFVGNDIELQHRKVFGIKADFAIAPVDDIAHAGQSCIRLLHQVHNLEYGSPCCYDILHDQSEIAEGVIKVLTRRLREADAKLGERP